MPLKSYTVNQSRKVPKPQEPTPSGVGCRNTRCKGEMMYEEPRRQHPEMPDLARAVCGSCGWMGWC